LKKGKVEIKLTFWKMWHLETGAHKIIRDPIAMADLVAKTLSHLGHFDVMVETPDRKYVILGSDKKVDKRIV
jgi:hypothetical protein